MKQITSFPVGPEGHRKTLRAQFLIQMHQIVPWAMLCALIEPHCREGLKKQPAVRLERMLRIVLLKQWFCLSDRAVEEALYDSLAMREFVGLDLNRDSVPDQNAIWRFRLVLEHRDLGRQLFAAVSQHLNAAGLKISIGTLVEANLISEPRWIERKAEERCDSLGNTATGSSSVRDLVQRGDLGGRDRVRVSIAEMRANVVDHGRYLVLA